MVNVIATQNALATDYGNLGNWIGLATTNPGTTSTPTGEASGGTPAYARIQATWGSASAGVITATAGVTINTAAATYAYMLIASSSSGNNMQDNASISSVVMGAQGTIVVTPSYQQT
jgi:hypothetical protein